jgi:hypothetical protein
MAFELRDGQGTLFKNDKQGNDRRPDYRGELNIGGTIYRISAWVKVGRKGKYMSLAADRNDHGSRSGSQQSAPADFDDDIPF